MTAKPFRFKQFSVLQDRCAMKIGTDGVLLGAWAAIPEGTGSILDIGTGTGLISLQMAQRCSADIIDALEIEDKAFEQAVENFENSPWSDRLFCYHASVQEFKDEIEDQYDLIISNPPFYNNSYKDLDQDRALARHTEGLSFEELLSATSKLLSPEGSCAFVIPFAEEGDFVARASSFGLHLSRITRVRGHAESEIKRSLLQFTWHPQKAETKELIIETKRHVYTGEYIDIVKEFYLNM